MKHSEPQPVHPSNKVPEAGGFIPFRLCLNHPDLNPTQLIRNPVKLRTGEENTKSYFRVDTRPADDSYPWVSYTGLLKGSCRPHQEHRWLLLQARCSPKEAAEEGITDSSDGVLRQGEEGIITTCESRTDTAREDEANNDTIQQYLMIMTSATNGIKQSQIHVTVHFWTSTVHSRLCKSKCYGWCLALKTAIKIPFNKVVFVMKVLSHNVTLKIFKGLPSKLWHPNL